MEEGTKTKKTIFVGGIADNVDQAVIYESFATFGDIIEVQLPSSATNPTLDNGRHRGFAFVTYGSSADAQDAIDNMDLNEMGGRVIKVNLARPMKVAAQAGNRAIWDSEEWLQQNAKPKEGSAQARDAEENGEGQAEAMEE